MTGQLLRWQRNRLRVFKEPAQNSDGVDISLTHLLFQRSTGVSSTVTAKSWVIPAIFDSEIVNAKANSLIKA